MSGKSLSFKALSPTLMTGSDVKLQFPSERSTNGLILAGNLEGKYAQSNRVFRKEGNAPTLTTKSDGLKILVKGATIKGYQEAQPGDSINPISPYLRN